MKVAFWVLFGLSIITVIISGFLLNYSTLEPAQEATAKLVMIGFALSSAFYTILELWTLFDNKDRNHISPVMGKLLKTSKTFRVFFAGVLSFVVLLTLHFLGLAG